MNILYKLTFVILAIFFFWIGSLSLGDGPYWPWYSDYVNGQCDEYWWSPTFFLSSVAPEYSFSQIYPLEGCFSWAWYISVEIMCFICTPVLIYLFYKKKIVGISITGVIIIFSIFCGIIICTFENLSVGIGEQTDSEHGDYYNQYYSKPYTRMHSYFLGVLITFCLHMKPSLRVPVFIRIIIYAIVWPVIWCLFFITYNIWNRGGWNDTENVIFAALHHPVFSCCFAISIYLMSLGYKGPLNLRNFFAHRFWIPFSKLSYGVYLYTPVIILMSSFCAQISLAYTSRYIVYQFFVFSVIAYAGSLGQYILIERPLLLTFDFFVDLSRIAYAKRKINK